MNSKFLEKWIWIIVGIQIFGIVVLYNFPCSGAQGFISCDYIYKVSALFFCIPISLILDLCLWRFGVAGISKKWSVGKWIGYSVVATIAITVAILVVLRGPMRMVGLGVW